MGDGVWHGRAWAFAASSQERRGLLTGRCPYRDLPIASLIVFIFSGGGDSECDGQHTRQPPSQDVDVSAECRLQGDR